MSDAQRADEWRHRFWIDAMRTMVADVRSDARDLRAGADTAPDGTLRLELGARADECDRIARVFSDEIDRLERWR